MKFQESCEVFCKENLDLARRTLEELVRIPAFTGEEAARAKYCLGWLDNQGIFGGRTDGAGNVVWHYQPENPDAVLVTAHLDTVFPMDTPLKIETDGDILRCPGISDNTVHGMLLLLAAKYLKEEKPKLPYGLILAWDTGEEGLGNLAGCKALVKTYGERLLGVLALDLYRDKIYTNCIGSLRYRITAEGDGGHSFLDFGRENAIAGLARLITKLYQVNPKAGTTYNVGTIEGGSSVNTIAAQASMLFEYRSDSYEELERCRKELERTLEEERLGGLSWTAKLLGERPCARNVDAKITERFAGRLSGILTKHTGVIPEPASASTDCNIPLSRGIPAICVGLVRGGGAHTRQEWLDASTIPQGLSALIEILLSMGEVFLSGR